ncbi:MAG: hypothetical protein KDK51_04665 [Deltaproteobacteria bacterium]|nr:hypothetical protein [Deltaproteobacteria bacterium]
MSTKAYAQGWGLANGNCNKSAYLDGTNFENMWVTFYYNYPASFVADCHVFFYGTCTAINEEQWTLKNLQPNQTPPPLDSSFWDPLYNNYSKPFWNLWQNQNKRITDALSKLATKVQCYPAPPGLMQDYPEKEIQLRKHYNENNRLPKGFTPDNLTPILEPPSYEPVAPKIIPSTWELMLEAFWYLIDVLFSPEAGVAVMLSAISILAALGLLKAVQTILSGGVLAMEPLSVLLAIALLLALALDNGLIDSEKAKSIEQIPGIGAISVDMQENTSEGSVKVVFGNGIDVSEYILNIVYQEEAKELAITMDQNVGELLALRSPANINIEAELTITSAGATINTIKAMLAKLKRPKKNPYRELIRYSFQR